MKLPRDIGPVHFIGVGGIGTRIAGRPMAASSATVDAPDRDTTRWLAAIRAGKSAKNGATSAVTAKSA